jgi:hypothetical protein
MRHALLLSLLALVACSPEPEPPTRPPLQPVEREADLYWTVDGPLPAGFDAAALRPAAIVLGPDAAPALDGLGEAAFEAALASLQAAAPGVALGFTLPMLPEDAPNELCFDPVSPTSDEFLRARQDALLALLQGHEAIDTVVVDPATGTRVDDVLCFCTPCESTGPFGQAQRLSAAWSLLSDGTRDAGATPWMWDHDPSGADAEALDVLRTDLHPETSLRVRAGARHFESPWTPDPGAVLDGGWRRVAADVDVTASHQGPLSVALLDAWGLVDRVRRQRLSGVETWFLQLGAGAPGALAEASMAHALFLDFDATPEHLLAGWIQERWGIDASTIEGAALADAIGSTRRALDLATHPLGIAVEGAHLGVPGAGPVTFLDPVDPAWAARFAGTQVPGQQDLLQAHQWLYEGVALAEAAVADLEVAVPALPPGDAVELRRQLDLLLLATNAWARRLDAEFALKFGGPGVAWALDDADALDDLALTADAVPTATFPVDGDTLREAAAWIRETAGPGTAASRPFPLITDVRFDFVDDRTNVRWHVSPGGTGWSERGSVWPDYPESSAVGEQDASEWTAWVRQLPANTRTTFRACSNSAGFSVCSADNVLWTPP